MVINQINGPPINGLIKRRTGVIIDPYKWGALQKNWFSAAHRTSKRVKVEEFSDTTM